MSVEIYVMPLWRFKAGDTRTAVEIATGIKPKIVDGNGDIVEGPPPGWWVRWKARREVASLCRKVGRVNGTRIRWPDEGGQVYVQQSVGMGSLRAFARWLDLRDQFQSFDAPPKRDFYKHPVMKVKRSWSFPHLVRHCCYNGYFLPCDFETPTEVEPYLIFGQWPANRNVASSVRLRDELRRIRPEFDALTSSMPSREPHLEHVGEALAQLEKVARISCEENLPIIFWG
jgi:hypothetical protein